MSTSFLRGIKTEVLTTLFDIIFKMAFCYVEVTCKDPVSVTCYHDTIEDTFKRIDTCMSECQQDRIDKCLG